MGCTGTNWCCLLFLVGWARPTFLWVFTIFDFVTLFSYLKIIEHIDSIKKFYSKIYYLYCFQCLPPAGYAATETMGLLSQHSRLLKTQHARNELLAWPERLGWRLPVWSCEAGTSVRILHTAGIHDDENDNGSGRQWLQWIRISSWSVNMQSPTYWIPSGK